MNLQNRSTFRPLVKLSLAAAITSAMALPQLAHAGSFQLPTSNAAGWGRAQAGGSLWMDDPTAAYNNPAAMAFFDAPMLQVTGTAIRPQAKFDGQFLDQQGRPVSGGNPDGFGKFKQFPNIGFVAPVSDRFALGGSLSVPYGLKSEYNPEWQGRYFGTKTSVQSVAASISASFKVNDEFAMGLGILGQYTKAQLNTVLDPYGSANALFGAPVLTPQSGDVQLNVNVKRKTSFGWFGGFVWKLTPNDTFGVSYHSRVRNTLSGDYSLYGSASSLGLLEAAPGVAAALGRPGAVPALNPDGASAYARLDNPAFASIDWVHVFTDRFSMGATAMWTGWSSFQSLELYSQGQLLVGLPEKYKDSWMYSIGGEYKVNSAWTLRAGVGYDQTPTNIISRDPRIPDGSRRIVGLGVGYKATDRLAFDLGYQHQFVSDTPVSQTNQLALGAGSMNGKFKDKGDVVSLSGTYRF